MDHVPAKYTDAIAANIRARRAYARMNQATLAERMRTLGFTAWQRQTTARIEQGQRHVLAEELLGLAQALETTIDRLLDEQR